MMVALMKDNSRHSMIRAGSRSSPLALVQIGEIESLLGEKGIPFAFEKVRFQTQGDEDKTTPLTQSADNFFTDALDRAVAEGRIDIAVHSAKDLPQDFPHGLAIFALTRSIDDTDAFVGNISFKNLKPGARIGTSSAVRRQSLLQLRPDCVPVEVRGTIQERIKLMQDGHCDGLIIATAALKRLKLEHLVKDIMPWEATPLQGQLAIVGRVQDMRLRELFSVIDVRRSYGKVILAGAGPGDPDLITVKAQKALASADCVLYDYLVDPKLLDYAPQAEHIFAGKRKGCHSLPQPELNRMLKDKAVSGKIVVRLKGGDPFIFGRGADELEYLMSHHIPVEVIPGVSSATAVPSNLGLPLTARSSSSSVAFVSGHGEAERAYDPQPIEIPDAETIVFLMGLTKLDQIIDGLKKKGWPDDVPAMVISKGTTVEEQTVYATIATIRQAVEAADLMPPALIVVGKSVQIFDVFRRRKDVTLFTGLHPQLYKVFEPMIHLPTVEIAPAQVSRETIENLKRKISGYHGLILTSGCGVKHFKALLDEHRLDFKSLLEKTAVVIGDETARAFQKHFGRAADIIAQIDTSEGLLTALFEKMEVKGNVFLFPRSMLPNPTIKTEIEKRGGCVEELAVYENRKPAKRAFPKTFIKRVIFTSPSTVRHYLEDYGSIPREWTVLARGPLTGKELEKAGYKSLQIIV